MYFVLFLAVLSFQDHHFNSKGGYFIQGYDVVSYFESQPKMGVRDFQLEYQGVKFLFSSQSNKLLFETDPNKYLPEYGGWCAYAMGDDGSKVKVDPLTYKIVDNKLYLFYNFWGTNTLLSWNENELNLRVTADINWQNIVGEE